MDFSETCPGPHLVQHTFHSLLAQFPDHVMPVLGITIPKRFTAPIAVLDDAKMSLF